MKQLLRSILVCIFSFCILSLSGCSSPQNFEKPVQDPGSELPEFWVDECPFEVSEDDPVTCGYLAVPEDRTRQDGPTVELAVAILNSVSTVPLPDPVLYLDGGPGGSALIGIDDWLESPLRADRQIILFDQRGTGYSWPNLDCPETDAFDAGDVPEGVPQIEVVEECRDRLRGLGIDLSMYNSATSAADVRDLFDTLGPQFDIDEWNLFGISYGTRLALTVMRDHPQKVRSVVLDSVYPPNVDAYTVSPQTQADAILALFASCAGDADCANAYPDLNERFFELVDRLNTEPADIDGEFLAGDDLVHGMVGMLYDSTKIVQLPHAIAAATDGDFDPWLALQNGDDWGYRQGGFQTEEELADAQGVFYSVECNEELPFGNLDLAHQIMADYPTQLADPLLGELAQIYDACSIWGAGEAAPRESAAVNSDIHTLLLTGEFDPVTPPTWAELAAQTLPNSRLVELPRSGHSVSSDGDCTMQIIVDFVNELDADPNVECASMIPAFATP